MHGENEPPLTLTIPLRVKRMLVIGKGQELHPTSFFSYNEEYHHKGRYKSPPCRGLENDAMSKALNQISIS